MAKKLRFSDDINRVGQNNAEVLIAEKANKQCEFLLAIESNCLLTHLVNVV
ncbi:hypothetical protein RMSM_02225 [Rhodopirellula maiorica SM1]|uniref:Uncharacterized protein n=1 Tax=Rhodopirellula maiorica SM1 TaxID=1265738 RepID=M5RNU4_9BACT|nr:hypothetical protein RMSM_02225 [Rhodopirellula maiorica SM1]